MKLPAIPSGAIVTPEQIAEVGGLLVQWAEQTEDAAEVKDAADRWAAITEYVRRQNNEGVAQAEATLRRLELRVSVLLPDAVVGSHASAIAGVNRDERRWFRKIGAHPDIVEQVIAESSDADPASRRKVLRAIDNAREIDDANAWAKEHNARIMADGYDPTDDKRREPILHAILAVIDAAARIEKAATPADVAWTLDTSKHLGEQLRTDLAAAIDIIQTYREQL